MNTVAVVLVCAAGLTLGWWLATLTRRRRRDARWRHDEKTAADFMADLHAEYDQLQVEVGQVLLPVVEVFAAQLSTLVWTTLPITPRWTDTELWDYYMNDPKAHALVQLALRRADEGGWE